MKTTYRLISRKSPGSNQRPVQNSLLLLFLPVCFNLLFALSQNVHSSANSRQVPCAGNSVYHKSEKLRSCTLAEDYKAEGHLLPKGSSYFFHENGRPAYCFLSKETPIYGQTLPENTRIFFKRWGFKLSFWLPKETRIQGHLIASTRDGIGNALHENGKLKAIWLAGEEVINGVPCSSSENIFRFGLRVISYGTNRMAWFYENGQLQQAMVARKVKVQGHGFKKGDIIHFDQMGNVVFPPEKKE